MTNTNTNLDILTVGQLSDIVSRSDAVSCFEKFFGEMENDESLKDDEEKKDEPVCVYHANEPVQYFCSNCNAFCCQICVQKEHPEEEGKHCCHLISDNVLEDEVTTMKNLIAESQNKLGFCETHIQELMMELDDLNFGRDSICRAIVAQFQSLRALLETHRDHLLKEASDLHEQRRLQLRESVNKYEETKEKLEEAVRYAQSILDMAAVKKTGLKKAIDFIRVKNVITTQLLLLNEVPTSLRSKDNITFSPCDMSLVQANLPGMFGSLSSIYDKELQSPSSIITTSTQPDETIMNIEKCLDPSDILAATTEALNMFSNRPVQDTFSALPNSKQLYSNKQKPLTPEPPSVGRQLSARSSSEQNLLHFGQVDVIEEDLPLDPFGSAVSPLRSITPMGSRDKSLPSSAPLNLNPQSQLPVTGQQQFEFPDISKDAITFSPCDMSLTPASVSGMFGSFSSTDDKQLHSPNSITTTSSQSIDSSKITEKGLTSDILAATTEALNMFINRPVQNTLCALSNSKQLYSAKHKPLTPEPPGVGRQLSARSSSEQNLQGFGQMNIIETDPSLEHLFGPAVISPLRSITPLGSRDKSLPSPQLNFNQPQLPVTGQQQFDLSDIRMNLAQIAYYDDAASSVVTSATNTPSPTPVNATVPLDSVNTGGFTLTDAVINNLSQLAKIDMSNGLSTTASTPSPASITPTPGHGTNSKPSVMQIRCKFGRLGGAKGEFSSPHGFCLGMEEEIVIADTNNHRICIFDKEGGFKHSFGVAGKDEAQLWYPRKVAIIRGSPGHGANSSPRYVICDRGSERSRMQIFTRSGHFVRKIAIRYIDIVAGLAITTNGHIVAVDSVSPTVFVIAETGDLLRWFDCSEHMREPSDIAINNNEYYICDFKGHCVVVFNDEGQYMRKIGCEGITSFPNGIDISDAGDILVGDSHGNRFHVVVFDRNGTLVSEFECPYVKVSRCCGLKITSEGYVVTLAKNNHHVLILNTLYIM